MSDFQRLIFRVILFVMTAFLVVGVHAQDSQENSVTGSYTIYTATDILSDNPQAIQVLRDAGYTEEDIESLKKHLQTEVWLNSFPIPLPLASTNSATDFFPVGCLGGAMANIILQVGTGGHMLTHTYADNLTFFVGAGDCPTAICLISAGAAARPLIATSFFTATSLSYNHHIHSWCS